jgi:hypothetical protein
VLQWKHLANPVQEDHMRTTVILRLAAIILLALLLTGSLPASSTHPRAYAAGVDPTVYEALAASGDGQASFAGGASGPSNRVGEFDFGLTRGN